MQVLRHLASRDHEIVAIATDGDPDRPGVQPGRLAATLGLTVLPAAAVTGADFAATIRRHGIDLLLNVHSLHVAHPDVAAAPAIGSFNLHPGPLPEYAGLNAPSWAIYHGEARHAATVHWMDAGIDTGPIAYEEWFDLDGTDTGLTVSSRCVRLGVALVGRLLDAAARAPETIPRREQRPGPGRRFGRRPPHDGNLDWGLDARRIADWVRAADFHPLPSPWGAPLAVVRGQQVGVAAVTALEDHAGTSPGSIAIGTDVRVAAADRWVRLDTIIVEEHRHDALAWFDG